MSNWKAGETKDCIVEVRGDPWAKHANGGNVRHSSNKKPQETQLQLTGGRPSGWTLHRGCSGRKGPVKGSLVDFLVWVTTVHPGWDAQGNMVQKCLMTSFRQAWAAVNKHLYSMWQCSEGSKGRI